MNSARAMMRLVKDDDPVADRRPLPSAVPVLDQLGQLQDEIQNLHAEINGLRRRDETLRFYMHRLDEELRLAARIQQDFLPKFLPQVGRVHFHTLFRPAGYVSGDLYDVMRLDEHHLGFFVCDAVGHGMPAALLTMFIKRALMTKDILPAGYRLLDPAETISHVNMALVDQALSQATYATALYGLIDTRTLTARFAKGGHPSPALLRADGRLEFPEATGALLGIFPDEIFTEATVRLAPGDRLFIYTDGVEVGFCDQNIADTERWRDELFKRRHLPTEEILTQFSEALDAQSGSLQPKDDLTIIVLDVK